MTTFTDLGLIAPLTQALAEENYVTPTPIQAQSIPHLLAGRDLLGLAQTGTGKTAAFTLPTLQRLMEKKLRPAPKTTRVLILCPTRELAVQIQESIQTYGRHLPIRSTMIFGGVTQFSQVRAMQRGIEIVVATPGRLRDLINQGHVDLKSVEVLILDEADRMLDMGFMPEIRKIVALVPKQRQTLLFSATMPREISDLAYGLLTDPVRVEVAPVSSTAERVEQKLYHVTKNNKRALLAHVLRTEPVERALLFTRTKHGADRVAENLEKDGFKAAVIHGNKSQNARQRALGDLKSGRINLLIATDIAARGIDVDGVTHVINIDLPVEPESYVHRIGRTARAGASGIALSFCEVEERAYLRDIEKITRQAIPVVEEHPFNGDLPPLHVVGPKPKRGGNRMGGQNNDRDGGRGERKPRAGQAQRKRQDPRRQHDDAAFFAELKGEDRPQQPQERRDRSASKPQAQRRDENRRGDGAARQDGQRQRDARQPQRSQAPQGRHPRGDDRQLSQPAAMMRELEAREIQPRRDREGERQQHSRSHAPARQGESRQAESRGRDERNHHSAAKNQKGERQHQQGGRRQDGQRSSGPRNAGGQQKLKRNHG
ncbi:MAG TPA: DEAD/DEAH box helicase [Terriglobia bacterium]|nr:DEAD/DEAH box helicase [Terriglobia bacterium]